MRTKRPEISSGKLGKRNRRNGLVGALLILIKMGIFEATYSLKDMAQGLAEKKFSMRSLPSMRPLKKGPSPKIPAGQVLCNIIYKAPPF